LAGLASFYFYPDTQYFAANTYLSENALMPGSAKVDFGNQNVAKAMQYTEEFLLAK
jgi:hypothetical protein